MLDFLKKKRKPALDDVPLPPPSMAKIPTPASVDKASAPLPKPPVSVKAAIPVDIPPISNHPDLAKSPDIQEVSMPAPKSMPEPVKAPASEPVKVSVPDPKEVPPVLAKPAKKPEAMKSEPKPIVKKIPDHVLPEPALTLEHVPEDPPDLVDIDSAELKKRWAKTDIKAQIRSAIDEAEAVEEAAEPVVEKPITVEVSKPSAAEPSPVDFSLPDFEDIPEAEEVTPPKVEELQMNRMPEMSTLFVRAYQYLEVMEEKSSIRNTLQQVFKETSDMIDVNKDQDEVFNEWYVNLNSCQDNLIKVDKQLFER